LNTQKMYQWRIWSEPDQHLELYFESGEPNHAVLPEPFTGEVDSNHYYIKAVPAASEEKTRAFLQALFREDEEYRRISV